MTILFGEFDDFSTRHPIFSTYFRVLMALVAISFPILSLVLFPFYVRVNRKNRKRDEKTAIFPITNYFYKTICVTESITTLGIILSISMCILLNASSLNTVWPLFFSNYWTPVWFVKMNVTMVVNVVTSFLAFDRFLLYFSPKIGNFITPSKKVAKWLLIGLHAIMLGVMYVALYSPGFSDKDKTVWDTRLQIIQLSFNLLVILCTFPYFLMIMSIRKLSYLSSNIQSQPEQYIKCQIMIILLSKLLLIPFLFTMNKTIESPNSSMGAPVFVLQLLCETIMTPLMIQSAYLLSNKAHFDTLKSSMCSWKSLRKPFHRIDSRVEPAVYTVPVENRDDAKIETFATNQ